MLHCCLSCLSLFFSSSLDPTAPLPLLHSCLHPILFSHSLSHSFPSPLSLSLSPLPSPLSSPLPSNQCRRRSSSTQSGEGSPEPGALLLSVSYHLPFPHLEWTGLALHGLGPPSRLSLQLTTGLRNTYPAPDHFSSCSLHSREGRCSIDCTVYPFFSCLHSRCLDPSSDPWLFVVVP